MNNPRKHQLQELNEDCQLSDDAMDQNVRTQEEEKDVEEAPEPSKDEDNNLTNIMNFLQQNYDKIRGNKQKMKKENEKKGFV